MRIKEFRKNFLIRINFNEFFKVVFKVFPLELLKISICDLFGSSSLSNVPFSIEYINWLLH